MAQHPGNSHAFENAAYSPDPPPPYAPHQPPEAVRYGGPVQPVVIAMPPRHTGGLFLDPDEPVMIQPLPGIGMSPAAALEYLKNTSSLIIKQKIEVIEILTNFDTQNRFTIYDQNGQVVFYALEDSDCCARQCCGPSRSFDMKILDIYQNEVIHIYRPLACQSCCCFCCLMNVEVTSPPGTIVGKVQQEFSLIYPKYAVENAVGQTVLQIDGPCWTCSCGSDVVFKVMSADGKVEVGEVSKKWSGFAQEYFTDADNFKVSFPSDLDVSAKATVLGAVFLINAMYFEKKK